MACSYCGALSHRAAYCIGTTSAEDLTEVGRIIDRHRKGQRNDYNDMHTMIAVFERLKNGLIELKKGIEDHADDTVWVSKIETACDKIEALLIPHSQSDRASKP